MKVKFNEEGIEVESVWEVDFTVEYNGKIIHGALLYSVRPDSPEMKIVDVLLTDGDDDLTDEERKAIIEEVKKRW